jgi:hypothetical protein
MHLPVGEEGYQSSATDDKYQQAKQAAWDSGHIGNDEEQGSDSDHIFTVFFVPAPFLVIARTRLCTDCCLSGLTREYFLADILAAENTKPCVRLQLIAAMGTIQHKIHGEAMIQIIYKISYPHHPKKFPSGFMVIPAQEEYHDRGVHRGAFCSERVHVGLRV